ncbi:MAG: hypothetical protein ACRCR9_01205 [Chitinophagaceae bacterium]
MVFFHQGFSESKQPSWLYVEGREKEYSQKVYFTGFMGDNVAKGESVSAAINRLKNQAQASLSESIIVKIESETKSKDSHIYSEGISTGNGIFQSDIKTTSNIEIVGIKMKTYYSNSKNKVYVLAYVTKKSLFDYYKTNLLQNISFLKGALQTTNDFIQKKAKIQAKQQYEQAVLLLSKISDIQNLLVVIDHNIDSKTLEQDTVEVLTNQLLQLFNDLKRSISIYINSQEDVFGVSSIFIKQHLKAQLAQQDFSFINDASKADFQLNITATTRQHNIINGIIFCYADVYVEVFDLYRNKNIFGSQFREKGAAKDPALAGEYAFENMIPTIANEVIAILKN